MISDVVNISVTYRGPGDLVFTVVDGVEASAANIDLVRRIIGADSKIVDGRIWIYGGHSKEKVLAIDFF
jgi:hypothetical protein